MIWDFVLIVSRATHTRFWSYSLRFRVHRTTHLLAKPSVGSFQHPVKKTVLSLSLGRKNFFSALRSLCRGLPAVMPVRKKYPEPPTTWTYDIYNPRWPHTPLAKRILKPFDIKRVCLTRKPKTAWENLRGMPAIIWHHTFDLRYCLFGVALATYIYYKLRPKSGELFRKLAAFRWWLFAFYFSKTILVVMLSTTVFGGEETIILKAPLNSVTICTCICCQRSPCGEYLSLGNFPKCLSVCEISPVFGYKINCDIVSAAPCAVLVVEHCLTPWISHALQAGASFGPACLSTGIAPTISMNCDNRNRKLGKSSGWMGSYFRRRVFMTVGPEQNTL